MRVLLCKQGEEARFIDVRNELEELQAIVDGHIEVVPFFRDTVLICNEEGKLRDDLKPNRFMTIGNRLDRIQGDFFICGTDCEEFADVPTLMEPLLFSICKRPHFDKDGEPL